MNPSKKEVIVAEKPHTFFANLSIKCCRSSNLWLCGNDTNVNNDLLSTGAVVWSVLGQRRIRNVEPDQWRPEPRCCELCGGVFGPGGIAAF